jgi:hypothetical protein
MYISRSFVAAVVDLAGVCDRCTVATMLYLKSLSWQIGRRTVLVATQDPLNLHSRRQRDAFI